MHAELIIHCFITTKISEFKTVTNTRDALPARKLVGTVYCQKKSEVLIVFFSTLQSIRNAGTEWH